MQVGWGESDEDREEGDGDKGDRDKGDVEMDDGNERAEV